jgi:hypothetical protein
MIRPLISSIASCLFEQPEPAGWHSFSQQQQQAEGDAAVADAPPAADPGAAPDPNADILSFDMPDAGAIAADILKGETPDITKGKKPAAPPAVKPPEPKPAEPGKTQPKPGEEPIAQLRSSYETLKAEHTELKKRVEAGDPRLKALEAERDAAKKELDSEKKRTADYEQKMALENPAVVKELRDADAKYNGDAAKFYRSVPEISHPVISDLVTEYAQLPFNKPGYADARNAFEAKVNRALGGDDTNHSRKLEKTLEWIEASYDYGIARPGIEQRVRQNARKLSFEHEQKSWGEKKTHVSGLIQKAFGVPEGMDKTDPHHPQVVLKRLDEGFKPEQVAAFDKGIAEFVELAINGVPPRGESDYAGLTPQQIEERKAVEGQNVAAARDHLVTIAVNGLKALRRLPTLYALLAKLKEKSGSVIEGEPPDPGTGDPGTANGDDFKFDLPSIPSEFR